MSDQFMEIVLMVAGICLFLMMIPIMFRIIIGPTAIDRIVAVNIIGTKTAVLLIIIGALFDNVSMFVDFAANRLAVETHPIHHSINQYRSGLFHRPVTFHPKTES